MTSSLFFSALPIGPLSPGYIQGTRVASLDTDSEVILANGPNLYYSCFDVPEETNTVTSGPCRSLTSRPVNSTSHQPLFSHSYDISHVSSFTSTNDDPLVLSVDDYGNSHLLSLSKSSLNTPNVSKSATFSAACPFPGYHSAAFLSNSSFCISSMFSKTLSLYDVSSSTPLRSFKTFDPIYNITTSHDNSNLVHLLENTHLTSLDLRLNYPIVSRFAVGSDTLYTGSCSNHLIAVSGLSRSVSVVDSRKWSAVGRWKNASKYEISSILFSKVDPDTVYISSLDNEVSAGKWNNTVSCFQKRDVLQSVAACGGRINGLSLIGRDSLVYWSLDGNLYLLRNAFSMCVGSNESKDQAKRTVGASEEVPVKKVHK
ncbi:hypothetical protein RCL1_000702 [Eukaryota sp. TZLM3-RCL]